MFTASIRLTRYTAVMAQTILIDRSEQGDSVVRWREERLLHAGYDAEAALVIAFDREVDLHLAVSLLERGCPPDTALRILF